MLETHFPPVFTIRFKCPDLNDRCRKNIIVIRRREYYLEINPIFYSFYLHPQLIVELGSRDVQGLVLDTLTIRLWWLNQRTKMEGWIQHHWKGRITVWPLFFVWHNYDGAWVSYNFSRIRQPQFYCFSRTLWTGSTNEGGSLARMFCYKLQKYYLRLE